MGTKIKEFIHKYRLGLAHLSDTRENRGSEGIIDDASCSKYVADGLVCDIFKVMIAAPSNRTVINVEKPRAIA